MDVLLGLALSLHLGLEGDYNNVHPHVRLQQDHFIGGAYYNSEYTTSFYGGMLFENNKWNYEVGVVSGYDHELYPFFRSTYDLNDNTMVYVTPALEGDTIVLVVGVELWSSK
jgi:hypothetical protein